MSLSSWRTSIVTGGLLVSTRTLMFLVGLPLAIEGLGLADFGRYATLQGAISFGSIVGGATGVIFSRQLHLPAPEGERDSLKSLMALVSAGLAMSALVATLGVGATVLKPDASAWGSVFLAGFEAFITVYLVIGLGVLIGLRRERARNIGFGIWSLAPVVSGTSAIVFRSLAAFVASQALVALFAFVYCQMKIGHEVPLWPATVKWRRLRLERIYWGWAPLLNAISDVLFYSTDRVVLAAILGPSSVANYAIADRPARFVDTAISYPLARLVPETASEKRAAPEWLGRRTSAYLALTIPGLTALLVHLPGLLRWWIPEPLDDTTILAGRLFLGGAIATLPFKVYSHVRLGQGDIRDMARAKAMYGLFNIGATIFLVSRIGLIGAVIPTVFFWAVVYTGVWTRLGQQDNVEWKPILGRAALLVGWGSGASIGAAWLFGYPVAGAPLIGAVILAVLASYVPALSRRVRMSRQGSHLECSPFLAGADE